jgi:hypothetical protein
MPPGFGTDRRRKHSTLIRRALAAWGITGARVKSVPTTTNETYLDRYDDADRVIAALERIDGVAKVERVKVTVETVRVVWNREAH